MVTRKIPARSSHRLLIVTALLAIALTAPVVIAWPGAAASTVVTYRLEWEWGTAVPDEDGAGWTVTNDLGYQIHVTEGYLVTYSAELLPCQTAVFMDWLRPATAYAGHGGESSPTRTTQPLVELLNRPTAVILDSRPIATTNYCQLHYLIGTHRETAENSLTLIGSFISPAGDAAPFAFQTNLAWGANVPLPTELTATETAVTVIIQRDLSRLFNGIDFSTEDEMEVEKALLRNLVQATEIVLFTSDKS